VGIVTIVLALAPVLLGTAHLGVFEGPPRPASVSRVPWYSAFLENSPLTVTVTVDWQPVSVVATRRMVLSDPTLWRQMCLGDWDRLPASLRTVALQRMVARYGRVIDNRNVWREMTSYDWDDVPHPIRGLAYLQMIADWTEHYGLNARVPASEWNVTQVVQAIAMTESWFEHRAAHVNRGGDTDLGLGQLSAYARTTLTRLARSGATDFVVPTDEDYLNPFVSARALAFWFGLMLDEASGEVELAVRAYNQGITRARAGLGQSYLSDVTRVLRTYIATSTGSASWRYLRDRASTGWQASDRASAPASRANASGPDNSCGLGAQIRSLTDGRPEPRVPDLLQQRARRTGSVVPGDRAVDPDEGS
jgi:hypothetical protein